MTGVPVQILDYVDKQNDLASVARVIIHARSAMILYPGPLRCYSLLFVITGRKVVHLWDIHNRALV